MEERNEIIESLVKEVEEIKEIYLKSKENRLFEHSDFF